MSRVKPYFSADSDYCTRRGRYPFMPHSCSRRARYAPYTSHSHTNSTQNPPPTTTQNPPSTTTQTPLPNAHNSSSTSSPARQRPIISNYYGEVQENYADYDDTFLPPQFSPILSSYEQEDAPWDHFDEYGTGQQLGFDYLHTPRTPRIYYIYTYICYIIIII